MWALIAICPGDESRSSSRGKLDSVPILNCEGNSGLEFAPRGRLPTTSGECREAVRI